MVRFQQPTHTHRILYCSSSLSLYIYIYILCASLRLIIASLFHQLAMAMRWRQLLVTVLLFCVLVDQVTPSLFVRSDLVSAFCFLLIIHSKCLQAHFRKAVVEDEPVM